MPKRIVKRDNFDGGFIVTGKGDNAVITPKTEKPKPKPKFTRPKKEEQEKPKGIFAHASGHYWFRNTPSGRECTHIKVGKVKYTVEEKLGQAKMEKHIS